MALFAGIEAGGTKFVCAISDEQANLLHETIIPTTTPDKTMALVIDFFKKIHKTEPLSAFGIGSFGPVDLDKQSAYYGYITTAPKPGWQHFDFVGTMKSAFHLPIGFDTDVNTAALGEYRFGAAKNLDSFLYVTVGTGIGAGGMLDGKLMHGLLHPEMGHILIAQDTHKDPFEGVCPFHKNCLEGLASGPSMNKRWNVKNCAQDLPSDHPAWDLESDYLAQAFANYIMIVSPKKIIAGGGVFKQKALLSKIYPKVIRNLAGYIKHDAILKNIENYIISPELDDRSGILGAIALAEKAYQDAE